VFRIKTLFLATRPKFLLLPVVVVLLGTGIARRAGNICWPDAFFCLLGLLLLHISTNVLNDYFDYKSGIDFKTSPTPFSGGSGFLTSGTLKPEQGLALGLGAFLAAVPLGVYFFFVRGPVLIPLFGAGAVFVLLGTSHLTRIGYGAGEICAGLGLGLLPVWGTSYILSGTMDGSALYASVPSGILVFNLLFLNEFPDTEADRQGGRKTIPIQFGLPFAARLYLVLSAAVYLWIIAGVLLEIMPAWSLLGLLTLPLSFQAVRGSFAFADRDKLTAAQGANIIVILATQFLLGLGYFISSGTGAQ
jgi:1,4-dihydroxy-2-naphthoate polyprenyltransferase